MAYLIRTACLTDYVQVAHSVGIDPYKLLKQAGIDRACLLESDVRISIDAVHRLLETSARAARIEDFGLRLSDARNLSNLGPLGLVMRDASTLREAIELANHFMPLHNEALMETIEEENGVAILKMELAVGSDGGAARQGMELVVGVTYRIVRHLLGNLWRARPVCFSHRAPVNMKNHVRFFGPWVQFGCDFNGIVLEPGDLDMPLPSADAAMAKYVRRCVEPMLSDVKGSLSERIRRLVYEQLPTGHGNIERIARHLGMDSRTLQRHLAREGETFSAILGSVRIDLAKRYVEDRGRSLGEIADLLGFSSPSAFSRWFRNELDSSPQSWRSAQRAEPTFPARQRH
jgi:AraC-like DNA-binding protein